MDGAILAAYDGVNSSNDSAFLSTYNAKPAPSTDGGSPAYFNNSANINGYSIGQGWVGLRDVQISNAFKTAFGETRVNAVDTDSRVRPVFEWQYGGYYRDALNFIVLPLHGAQSPGKLLLSTSAAAAAGTSDNTPPVASATLASPIPPSPRASPDGHRTGPRESLPTGPPWAIPLHPHFFSAIAVTNGAIGVGQHGDNHHYRAARFVIGQSVRVSGVTVSGYNGTFTITSITPTTFTYTDSATGLANSGDGIVTGRDQARRRPICFQCQPQPERHFLRRLRGHHAVRNTKIPHMISIMASL